MPGCAGVENATATVADVLQLLIDRFCMIPFCAGNAVLYVYNIVREYAVEMLTGQ